MGKIVKKLLVVLISMIVFIEFFGLLLSPKLVDAAFPVTIDNPQIPISAVQVYDFSAEKRALKQTVPRSC